MLRGRQKPKNVTVWHLCLPLFWNWDIWMMWPEWKKYYISSLFHLTLQRKNWHGQNISLAFCSVWVMSKNIYKMSHYYFYQYLKRYCGCLTWIKLLNVVNKLFSATSYHKKKAKKTYLAVSETKFEQYFF